MRTLTVILVNDINNFRKGTVLDVRKSGNLYFTLDGVFIESQDFAIVRE